MSYDDYPWGDEPRTQREWKRTFKGLNRYDWNSRPAHANWRTCLECGYRWDSRDFNYRLNLTKEGKVVVGEGELNDWDTCWHCHMHNTDAIPAETREPVKATGGLKRLGGGL